MHQLTQSDLEQYSTDGFLLISDLIDPVALARYEDRLFIVLLPDVNAEAGREVGEEIRQAVSEAKVYSSHGDPLSPATVSVVVAEMIADDTPETFLSAAQETLVEIRKAGDNRVAVSDRSS